MSNIVFVINAVSLMFTTRGSLQRYSLDIHISPPEGKHERNHPPLQKGLLWIPSNVLTGCSDLIQKERSHPLTDRTVNLIKINSWVPSSHLQGGIQKTPPRSIGRGFHFLFSYTSYLDCQGVMTPSSGPPIITSCLILRKFFFHSEERVWV